MTQELALRRVSDIASPAAAGFTEGKKPADMLGIELILDGYDLRDGDYGTFAIIKCRVDATLSPVTVITGAAPIMAQLNMLTPIDMPLKVRFERFGERSFVLK